MRENEVEKNYVWQNNKYTHNRKSTWKDRFFGLKKTVIVLLLQKTVDWKK